jgi:hypothetical protein
MFTLTVIKTWQVDKISYSENEEIKKNYNFARCLYGSESWSLTPG